MNGSSTEPTPSRRALLAAGTAAATTGLAGCAGVSGPLVRRFDESDPLVTYNRVGKGPEVLSYWTSTFYMPAQSGNNQPELSPLTGPFYRTLKRRSAQPAAAPALRAQHEEWAAAHPGFRIDVSYPPIDEWKRELLTRGSEGTLPDGSTVNHPWLTEFYDHLRPLTDHVADVGDFFPFVRERAMRDGELVAAWKYTDCRCLYYRQDLLDRYGDGSPPGTWGELLDLGRTIADEEGVAGYLHYPSMANSLPFFWGQGGAFVDDDGAPVIGRRPNRQALVRTLSFLRRLVSSGATPRETATIGSYETLARRGRNDEVAMFVGGSWQIEKDLKNRVAGDRWRRWNVAPIPTRSSGEHVTVVGGWTESVFREGEGAPASAMKDFIAKFVEPESMGRYCEAAGLLPTRESLFGNRDLFDPDALPYYRAFREFLRDGRAQPAVPVYSTVRSAFETAMRAVLAGRSTPDAAATELIRQVNRAYQGGR